MRISTAYLFDQNLSAMLNKQAELAKTQMQVSTGNRIISPSDDPAGSVQILNLQREASLSAQYLANATKALNKQSNEESALQSAGDILQRVRELAVEGLNATNTPVDKKTISLEIKQLNDQLLALANTRDSNGDYLFSGFKSNTQPYGTINGDYQGDEGQRNIKVGEGVLIATNDPGNHVFEAPLVSTTITSTGTGTGQATITGDSGVAVTFSPITLTYNQATTQYEVSDGVNTVAIDYVDGMSVELNKLDPKFPSLTLKLTGAPAGGDQIEIEKSKSLASQSMFKTIENFANGLIADDVGANSSPNNGDFLTNISASLAAVIDARAKVGSRLNSIGQQNQINEGVSLSMKKALSEIKDLDYAEAISRLSLQMTGLQAAQQSFAKVQGLSLFNYL